MFSEVYFSHLTLAEPENITVHREVRRFCGKSVGMVKDVAVMNTAGKELGIAGLLQDGFEDFIWVDCSVCMVYMG